MLNLGRREDGTIKAAASNEEKDKVSSPLQDR